MQSLDSNELIIINDLNNENQFKGFPEKLLIQSYLNLNKKIFVNLIFLKFSHEFT